MSSIEKKVLYKIQGYGRGYAFSSSDFIKQFPSDSVDKALSLLVAKKKIRRIARGLYDYPKYSELLAQELSPDIEQVAYALARKFNWKIEISGNSALNILGLSTQIPGRYLYLSSGPNRTYTLCNQITLEFKKAALKNIGFKYKESSLIVQALKELGKENINQEIIDTIRKNIDEKMYKKILDDTKVTITWIYETIKQICKES
ncbi:MAG TPA: hypothetical protein CFH82_02400 [Sulfurospirillum sp. UBA12182]|jgi:hypothetical protein|nr:MAG TPA: hypothetical protein CFH82_02400 [Sulfurospirillum sp. UBA12182]